MEDVREELKQSLSTLERRGRGKPYPKGLLEKVLSYTVARRREGATVVAVAGEIGLNWRTLTRWVGERKAAGKRFERVEVVAPIAQRALVVHGPRGLRIEGLDLAGVAELVRRVGE
jgi:transposase